MPNLTGSPYTAAQFRRNAPNLIKYIESANSWDKACRQAGRPSEPALYDLNNMTEVMKVKLRGAIDCDLSPENLCCDGELRGADLRKKVAYLTAVKRELEFI